MVYYYFLSCFRFLHLYFYLCFEDVHRYDMWLFERCTPCCFERCKPCTYICGCLCSQLLPASRRSSSWGKAFTRWTTAAAATAAAWLAGRCIKTYTIQTELMDGCNNWYLTVLEGKEKKPVWPGLAWLPHHHHVGTVD